MKLLRNGEVFNNIKISMKNLLSVFWNYKVLGILACVSFCIGAETGYISAFIIGFFLAIFAFISGVADTDDWW